jgi:hypothetical protein
MFQAKVAEKIKTHTVYSNFLPKNRALNEIMWQNMVQTDRRQRTIRCMRDACWITKATDTHPEYVLFTALPLQQWLQERNSMLSYTYISSFDLLFDNFSRLHFLNYFSVNLSSDCRFRYCCWFPLFQSEPTLTYICTIFPMIFTLLSRR